MLLTHMGRSDVLQCLTGVQDPSPPISFATVRLWRCPLSVQYDQSTPYITTFFNLRCGIYNSPLRDFLLDLAKRIQQVVQA